MNNCNKEKELTWSQAIEKAIIQLGYIATLKDIHRLAPTFKKFEGKTPDRTINERVQRDDNFVKLKPGLYGLKNYLDKLPDEFNPKIEKTEDGYFVSTANCREPVRYNKRCAPYTQLIK